eukprot:7812288-Prorocentrum_lima.AAC.1
MKRALCLRTGGMPEGAVRGCLPLARARVLGGARRGEGGVARVLEGVGIGRAACVGVSLDKGEAGTGGPPPCCGLGPRPAVVRVTRV